MDRIIKRAVLVYIHNKDSLLNNLFKIIFNFLIEFLIYPMSDFS